MSGLRSGAGGAPKKPGAGKPIKGYPKVSGEDDATIDVRKKQQPPAELPPSQEPANEPPTESVAPSEPVEPAAPSEAGTASPEPPVPLQDDTETDGGAIPLPPSPAVPNPVEEPPGNALPQTVEEDRPSDPPRPVRPGWMEMPEANASVFDAEKVLPPADAMAGQTPPNAEDRTNGTDFGAMDEAGSGEVHPKEPQGPFASLGEGQNQFTDSSRKGRGPAVGESINQIVESLPTESAGVRRMENQRAAAPAVFKSAPGPVSVYSGAGQISPGGVNQETGANQAGGGSWDAIGDAPSSTQVRPAEFVWGEISRSHIGQRIKDRSGRFAEILQVKNGTVIARAETGQILPLWQASVRLVDDQGKNLLKPNVAPQIVDLGSGQKRKRNRALVGHPAQLIAKEGEPGVDLNGFKITTKFDRYLRMMEHVTNRRLSPAQMDVILTISRGTPFSRLVADEREAHASRFTKKIKDSLIAEWEQQTGAAWPRYTEDVPDGNGGVLRRKGEPYDAHHIIPQSYGGPHRWENLTPARCPNEHQNGIHKSPETKALFP